MDDRSGDRTVFSILALAILLLLGEEIAELVELVHSTLVGAELLAAELSGLLILDGNTGADQLHGAALVDVEAGDFPDDIADGRRSLGDLAFSGDGAGLPFHLSGALDDKAVVQADELAGSSISFRHVDSLVGVNL